MKEVKNLRYKRTLFVGLGGAGANTLRILKEKIYKANGCIPKQVKFLLIDTNATELSNFRDFECSEKVCIAVREPYQRYKHDEKLATFEYLPPRNRHSLLALERGAGQIRSNGHFAVIENQYSNKLGRAFRHAAEELENIDIKGETLEKDPKIEVRLVFSIAGGTGSGTFLPISVLLRSAIKHCELTAYIYSATHFERIVEKSAKYSVMQNAYASLAELDYLMHYGVKNIRQEPVKFNFGPDSHQQIEQCNRPFEEVYYIDKITSLPTPDTVEFAYNQLKRIQENTANALFLAATNIISAYTGTIDNVRQKIMEGQFNVGDKFAWVSGLGMAELFFDPQSASSPKVIKAAKTALEARLTDDSLSEEDKTKIVNLFTYKHWDESDGDKDGNPLIGKFPLETDIRNQTYNIVKSHEEHSYEDDVNLDLIMRNLDYQTPNEIVKGEINSYKKALNKLVEELIDDNEYKDSKISLLGEKDLGVSLHAVYDIVKQIQEVNGKSLEKIKDEQKDHNTKKGDLDKIVEETRRARTAQLDALKRERKRQDDSSFFSKFNPFKKKNNDEDVDDETRKSIDREYYAKLASDKADAATFWILACIDGKVIEILKGLISHTEQKLKEIESWIATLNRAQSEQPEDSNNTSDRVNYDETEKEENRVEAQIINVDNFRLSYSQIVQLDKNLTGGIKQEGKNAVFEALARLISHKSGKDLQEYLIKGINDIKKRKNDFYNKNVRTDLQKVIDRLIELSTPTMQVDRHGYGNRVNPDEFWYIMTDCGEDISAKDETERKKLKHDSVGGLLQKLIEGNTLDESVNLIHVSGWNNKAILYRVKAAVPPYFVEGVCSSDCGGITLESCYEELKLTKPTYTPFSHEMLRQKLETARTVLKPHDSMDKDEALTHWVRFMIKKYIKLEHEKNAAKEPKTDARGVYSIESESLGEFKEGKIIDEKKVLILGDTSRNDAFNMFARYCSTLINERPDYLEEINEVENTKYNETFNITRKEYLTEYIEGKGISQITIERYPEDDEDKILIRRELDLFKES